MIGHIDIPIGQVGCKAVWQIKDRGLRAIVWTKFGMDFEGINEDRVKELFEPKREEVTHIFGNAMAEILHVIGVRGPLKRTKKK